MVMSSSMLPALPSPDEEKAFRFGAFPAQDAQRKARPRYVRQLSDNEVAYFLPSRADGVNDMYAHTSHHCVFPMLNGVPGASSSE